MDAYEFQIAEIHLKKKVPGISDNLQNQSVDILPLIRKSTTSLTK